MHSITTTESTPDTSPVSIGDDALFAEQLAEQCLRAQSGEREILKTGAMMLRLRALLIPRVESKHKGRGRYAKNEGLKAWLAEHCPNIPTTTLYRYMEIASAVQRRCAIGAADELERLLKAPAETLAKKDQAKQLELFAAVEGESQRELLRRATPPSAKPKLSAEDWMVKDSQEFFLELEAKVFEATTEKKKQLLLWLPLVSDNPGYVSGLANLRDNLGALIRLVEEAITLKKKSARQ